ncbi:hypothetical protein HDZ31DRAFT_8243, partial [Schizophyllum fasciatum]
MSASASCASSSARPWNPPPDAGHGSDGQAAPPDGGVEPTEPWGSMTCPTCVQANSSRITYDGSWLFDDKDPQELPVSYADRPGASLSFRFNGSGIIAFGAARDSSDSDPPPAEASYVLDDCTPLLSREPLSGATDRTLLPLFATRELSEDEHSIVIKIENASSPYRFVGFSIAPQDANPGDDHPPPPFSGTWPPPSNTAGPSSSNPTVSPDNLPTGDTQHQGPDRTLVIALTSALAGVLCILSVGCTIFLVRNWRRRQRERREMSERSILTTTDSIMRNLPSLTWYSAS